LIVQLHGVESNRDGIGARLEVIDERRTQIFEIVGGDGFYASNERQLMVGLGKSQTVKSLSIKWPSGRREVLENIPANSHVTVVEGRASMTAPMGRALHTARTTDSHFQQSDRQDAQPLPGLPTRDPECVP
jgi:hypothetical protein